jgi:hypothetical protein
MLFDLTFPCYLTTLSGKKCLSGKVICAFFCFAYRSSPVWVPQVLADMIISNESRISKSYVVSNFRKARQYLASISVRYSDMGSVEGIAADMKAWLDASSGVDRSLPLFVGLASLDNHACNLTVLVGLWFQVRLGHRQWWGPILIHQTQSVLGIIFPPSASPGYPRYP